MQWLSEALHVSPETMEKILLSIGIFIILSLVRILSNFIIRRRSTDAKQSYFWQRTVLYIYTFLLILIVGQIWIQGIGSLTTFLGLASAGIAIALHDTIANIAGWFFIISRKPFKLGDRIQIGESAGDVVDIRLFQFSLVEIGNWVDADQSTGRIIHIPNSLALKEPLANYQIGFEYIWNELPVLVTFESNWKKAKQILSDIARDKVEHLSEGAEKQAQRTNKKYFIFYGKLKPIVYTSVKDSGVLLTIRYIVNPRNRRSTEEEVWESILDAFEKETDIDLAYPTTRFIGMGSEERPDAK